MSRLSRLKKGLRERNELPFLVTDLTNIRYLTGFTGTNATLVIGNHRNWFITDSRYEEYARSILGSSWRFFLQKEALTGVLDQVMEKEKGEFLFVEDHSIRLSGYLQLRRALRKRRVKIRSGGSPVNTLRMVKDTGEVDTLREAANITDRCVDHLKSFVKPGMTEWQVATEIEIFYRQNGCTGTSFPPIVASGAGSSMPHYETSMEKRIEKGEPLLIDMGCVYRGYNSDLTRTIFVGSIPGPVREIYRVVLEAQQKAVKSVRPGITTGKLDQVARDHIADCGYGDRFGHSLGHGFGLEVHELPAVKNSGDLVLKKNMTITIEPGIYLPGIGGVRIEDMVLVTARGGESMTSSERTMEII
jgi:Xaa-Pro aminopeptidase